MRALPLILLLCISAHAGMPPITSEEALAFHKTGACRKMGVEPGTGLRSDGEGWVMSSLPGRHVFTVGAFTQVLDMTPSVPVRLRGVPRGEATWCIDAKIAGRDTCGPVPRELLWPAVTVQPGARR